MNAIGAVKFAPVPHGLIDIQSPLCVTLFGGLSYKYTVRQKSFEKIVIYI